MAKSRAFSSTWQLDNRLREPQLKLKQTKRLKHKPYFKDHFPDLVAYVYLSRYVTKHHVFSRFPQHFNSDRTCERHLKQLVDLHYLTVLRPTPEPTFPDVYTTTGQGRSLIKRHFDWSIPPNIRDEVQTLTNVLHELYLTDFELYLHQALRNRDDLQVKGKTERRYNLKDRQLTFAHEGTTGTLRPDAGFILGQQTGSDLKLLLHFVELDMGTMNLPTLRHKFQTYDTWSHSPDGTKYLTELYRQRGKSDPQPTFRLLVLVRDSQGGNDFSRLVNLYLMALTLPPSTRNKLWLVTMRDLQQATEQTSLPLTQPIWYRGRAAVPWIDDFRTFAANLKRGPGQKPQTHQKSYVEFKLKQLDKVCLLPQRVS